MKSYFLEGLADEREAVAVLSELFPKQANPWVLFAAADDPITYFEIVDVSHLGEEAELWEGPFAIGVDVSGRHYNEDEKVLNALRQLQARLSGVIKDDFENVL